jgi:hypothetical protein
MHIPRPLGRPEASRSGVRARGTRFVALALTGLLTSGIVISGAPAGAGGRALATHADPLRAQWHLDEGGTVGDEVGTTPESSGHEIGSFVRFAGPVAGKFGNAFRFGSSSLLVAGSSPLLEPETLTVVAWVRAASSPGPSRYVVGKGGGDCAPAAYAMYTGSPGQVNDGGLHFYVRHAEFAVHAPSVPAAAIWNDAWHMVAGTFDGATARFYLDGVEIGSGQPVGGPIQYGQSSPGLSIGSYAAWNSCPVPTSFVGDIDEVRVYARPLSAAELGRLAAHPGPEPPALVPDVDAPPPPPPPVPDFTLAYADGAPAAPLVLAPGGEARLALTLERNISSLGRVGLSAEGLPAGVSASFAPAQLGGTATGRIDMTLRATGDVVPGRHRISIVATAIDATAGTVARRLDGVELLVQARLAVRVEGIEITQAVQTNDQPRSIRYSGVALVKHKKTVVRVFADLVGRELGSRPPFGMALFATGPGGPKPGSPLFPEWAPAAATVSLNDEGLTVAERNSPTAAFTFVLPDAWTEGPLRLEARALASSSSSPAAAETLLCLDPACGATPSRVLRGIRFRNPPAAAALNALEQVVVLHDANGNVTGLSVVKAPPAQVFEKLLALSPVPFHFLDALDRPAHWPRYRATRFASDSAIWEPADAYDESIGRPGLATVGVYVLGGNPGVTIGRTAVVSGRTDAGSMWRPVTSVAHEVFHRLGFKHASTACGAGDGEPWPVPNGRLDSVGIDTTPGSGGAAAPYRIIADTDVSPAYDLMSYCGIVAGDAPHWISARNWNRALGLAPPPPTVRVRIRDVVVIRAQVVGALVSILGVKSAQGPPPLDASLSAYTLVARDAGGRVLATAPVSQLVGTGAAGVEPVTVLEARVPAGDVEAVELTDASGTVVAGRVASPAAPRARILAPREGARVGAGTTLVVRWQATDADGDELDAALDVSSDGGRTFHNVWAGPGALGSARIPIELLDATDDARLRLRVSDGFNETQTTSGRFRIASRRPLVEILEPAPGQRADSGAAVRLSGAALDDKGRQVSGRQLVWFSGRTELGRGAVVNATLPAGTRRLRLEATDSAGRTGSTSVAVRVRPTTPFFVRLTAAPISRSARRAVLVVSATQPATLTVRGRRYRVGPDVRRIDVSVGPGPGAVRLELLLSAGGRRSVGTITVRRR